MKCWILILVLIANISLSTASSILVFSSQRDDDILLLTCDLTSGSSDVTIGGTQKQMDYLQDLSIKKDGETLATVTSFRSRVIVDGHIKPNLTGSVDRHADRKYIQLQWPNNTGTDGRYQCVAKGYDSEMNTYKLTKSLDVGLNKTKPIDIMSTLAQLQTEMELLNYEIKNQSREVTDLDTSLQTEVEEIQSTLQTRLEGLHNNIMKQSTKISQMETSVKNLENVTKHLTDIESTLQTEVLKQKTKISEMKTAADTVQTKLDTEVTRVQEDMTSYLADFESRLQKEVLKQSTKISEIETAVDTLKALTPRLTSLELRSKVTVYFTVGLSTDLVVQPGDVVVYDKVITHKVTGTDQSESGYNLKTGVFTSPVAGEFLFQVTVVDKDVNLSLQHNNLRLVSLLAWQQHAYVTGVNSALMTLAKGDRVKVTAESKGHLIGVKFPLTTFSGSLIKLTD